MENEIIHCIYIEKSDKKSYLIFISDSSFSLFDGVISDVAKRRFELSETQYLCGLSGRIPPADTYIIARPAGKRNTKYNKNYILIRQTVRARARRETERSQN